MPLKNTMIYLIGFPGVGKYTTALEICAQADFKLVDNHLINNPVFGLIEMDGKTKLPDTVWSNTRRIRDAVLDTMIHISPPDYSFVLTNMLLESDPQDRRWFEDVENVARARGATFVPVVLSCALEEHKKRIVTADRAARFKEIDSARPQRLHETESVLKIEHPNMLALDVTDISPVRAADIILEHARRF